MNSTRRAENPKQSYRLSQDFEPIKEHQAKGLQYFVDGDIPMSLTDSRVPRPNSHTGVRVYKPLIQIFFDDKVPYTESNDGRTDGYFSGSEFEHIYIDAYHEGEQHFKDKYEKHLNPFSITNEEKNTLKKLYFEAGYEFLPNRLQPHLGWLSARCQLPLSITQSKIKEIGYNVGILEAAERFMQDETKFPFVFPGRVPTLSEMRPFWVHPETLSQKYFIEESFLEDAQRRQTSRTVCLRLRDDDKYRVYGAYGKTLATEQVPYYLNDGSIGHFNGRNFIPTYIEKFKEGVRWFDQWSAGIIELDATDAKQEIQKRYFETGINGSEGWENVKTSCWIPFSLDKVKNAGYYAGIVNRCEELYGVPQRQSTSTESQPEGKESLIAGKNTFCDGMPLGEAYDHFHRLTTRYNKSGQSFLTEKQFGIFFRAAFKGEAITKQSITIKRGEAGFVKMLFHQFYTKAKQEGWESTDHCSPRYRALLSDHFSNSEFTADKLAHNFNDAAKGSWD